MDADLQERVATLEGQVGQLRRDLLDAVAYRTLRGLGAEERAPIRATVIAVAEAFGVRRQDILGETRVRSVTMARQAVMLLAVQHSGRSLAVIGRAIGRDHSTILDGAKAAERRADADPAYAARVLAAEALLLSSRTGDTP